MSFSAAKQQLLHTLLAILKAYKQHHLGGDIAGYSNRKARGSALCVENVRYGGDISGGYYRRRGRPSKWHVVVH